MRGALVVGLTLVARPPLGRAQPFPNLQFKINQQISVAVGAFDPDTGDGPGPNALTLADVDNDGNLDILAIDQDDDALWVLYGHGDGTFDVPTAPIDLSLTPTAVAVGDISSPEGPTDGKPDIIVTGDGGDVAEILLATGNRTFSSDHAQVLADLIDDSSNTVDVVVGNFDAGPEADVALLDVSDSDQPRVLFLCNSGGNLAPCATYDVSVDGTTPVDLGIGDFNGDGYPDVVTLNKDTKTYSVIYGQGNGQFNDRATTNDARADQNSDENVPFALGVGKMDGSGDQFDDVVIATAESFSDVSTLVAHSEGSRFTRNTATGPFSSAISLALADVDGDGLLDAVFGVIAPSGETALNRPEILIGDGVGSFQSSLANIKIVGGSMGEGQAVAAGNLNKDVHNLADIVQVNKDGDTIVVALNLSDGTPLPTDTPTQPEPTTPAATRTVTPTRPTSTVTLTPTITATRTPNAATYGRCVVKNFRDKHGSLAGVAIGNLDGGGGDDMVLSDDKNNRLYVIPNSAELRVAIDDCANKLAQTVTLPGEKDIVLPTGQKPGAVVAVDLDGNSDRDSQQDLVVIGSDSVLVYFNGGDATFTAAPVVLGPFSARPSAVVADAPDPSPGSVDRIPLDLNGDNLPDIVVALPNENQLRVFYGQAGHTFRAGTVFPAIPESAVGLAAGDFDGGFPDLVVATTRRVLLLHQDSRSASPVESLFVGQEPLFDGAAATVASAFFDNNQVADLLLARKAGAGGMVEVHLGAAPDALSAFTTAGEPIGAAIGAFNAADMTSDVAILTDSTSDPSVDSVIFGLGDGTGALPGVLQPASVSTLPRALAAGLIDNDLVHDVVTANNDGTFTILLSGSAQATPVPTNTLTATVTQTPSPTSTVPSPTPTTTPVGSLTPTTAPTSTPSGSPTPKAGVFSLTSCSINDHASDWPMHALVVMTMIALMRGRRRGALRGLLLLALLLIPLGAWPARADTTGLAIGLGVGDTPTVIDTAAVTATETETATPTEPSTRTVTSTPTNTHTPTVMLGWCTVAQAALGNPAGSLVGGVAAPLDNAGGVDLALLYDNDLAIERVDISALRLRACSRIVAPSIQAVNKGKGIAVAELDGDRLNDLIATEQNSDVVTFHNGGDGTLTTLGSRPANQPGPVAVGNLDDDTTEDLAIGSGADVAILKGTGGGKYNAPTSLTRLPQPSAIKRVIVADVNLDGLDDIVAVNQNGMFGVYVQGTGTPRFTLQDVLTLEAPEDLIVEDVNPDDPRGRAPDILYVSSSGLHVLLGSISGATVTFGTAVNYPLGAAATPSAVAVGRFDTDNNLDVAVADAAANVVYMFMGDGAGTLHQLPPENNQPTGPAPRGLVVADFDGDQMDDLVSLNSGDGSITFFLSTAATPTFTPTSTPTIQTPTVTLPPTATATTIPTATPTATPQFTSTPVNTVTSTPQATVTHTFGAFDVQGTCAVAYPTGLSDAMPLVVLAALALLRRRSKA